MIYLDTGCFVKLYYPEPDSARAVAQISAARQLVETDVNTGVLVSMRADWSSIFREASALAYRHTGTVGCRSLDLLHCAAAKVLAASTFITTDSRQKQLATAIGLKLANV